MASCLPRFNGNGARALRERLLLATPVVFTVREFWKNPQSSPVLQIRSLGGSDGATELRLNRTTLKESVGQEALVLLGAQQPFADAGSLWQEVRVLPIKDGKVYGTAPCVKGELDKCGVPLDQLRAQMLDALAKGRPYQMPAFQARPTPPPFRTP
jgi:hypothetical protein